jgi:hypothetical protein
MHTEPLLNHLLWSHYADNHQGFCLIFDLHSQCPFIPLSNVIYSDYRPTFEDYGNTPIAKIIRETKVITDTLLTKGKDWEYENEARIIIDLFKNHPDISYRNSNFFYNFGSALQGVIFGCRTSKSNRALMIRLLSGYIKKHNSSAFYTTLKKSNSRYKLEFENIVRLRHLSPELEDTGKYIPPPELKTPPLNSYSDYIRQFKEISQENNIKNTKQKVVYWSIYKVPSKNAGSEEVHYLKQKWPQAACHDGLNYVFVSCHPNAKDPIVISELTNIHGEQLRGDYLVAAVAKLMFNTDRSRAIHLTNAEANELHQHLYWKLWCGNYETIEDFKAAYSSAFDNLVYSEKITFERLKINARRNIKRLFS